MFHLRVRHGANEVDLILEIPHLEPVPPHCTKIEESWVVGRGSLCRYCGQFISCGEDMH